MVACDVDGTLSEIASKPTDAMLEHGALAALRALSIGGVHVMVMSGRSIGDLRCQFGLAAAERSDQRGGLTLVGSHGAELAGAVLLDPREEATLLALRADLERITWDVTGAFVEVKPCAVALHVRRVDPSQAEHVLSVVRERYTGVAGVLVLEGKQVIELAVRNVTKGSTMTAFRELHKLSSVMFVGDDVSDESVFEVLGPRDLAVRVGSGETLADCRLSGPSDVVQMLSELAEIWT